MLYGNVSAGVMESLTKQDVGCWDLWLTSCIRGCTQTVHLPNLTPLSETGFEFKSYTV